MNQENTADTLNYDENNKPKLSSGLNVLTILTFIGCSILLLFSAFGFLVAQKNYENMDEVISKMNSDEMPAFAKSMMPNPEQYREMITKSYENRIPLVLLYLVSIALCFYGALQMRKLKKQGYLLYVIGEILPFLVQVLFIGTFMITGVSGIFSICIAVLFILLYTMQRKNLIY